MYSFVYFVSLGIFVSETHFIISLESDKFFKLSILDRQRYLINILGKNIIDKVHSISFKLTVPLKKLLIFLRA